MKSYDREAILVQTKQMGWLAWERWELAWHPKSMIGLWRGANAKMHFAIFDSESLMWRLITGTLGKTCVRESYSLG